MTAIDNGVALSGPSAGYGLPVVDPMPLFGPTPPSPDDAVRHKHAVAMTVGGTFVTIGATAIIGAGLAAQTTVWFGPLVAGGVLCVGIGLYPLVFVPVFGLPFPSPRSQPIWRGAWSKFPLSPQARNRRYERRLRLVDGRLKDLLAGDVMRAGFDSPRATQSLFEAVIEASDVRRYWIYNGMLGFGSSGNVTRVVGSSENDPDVVRRVQQFEALVAQARQWPEAKQRKELVARIKR
jgi:hypothetical protein